VPLAITSGADLLAYVGLDAFMDFQIPHMIGKRASHNSHSSFSPALASPISVPTCAMFKVSRFSGAYTRKAALEGWIRSEKGQSILQRAAAAYDK
jgi:hypothetical protein